MLFRHAVWSEQSFNDQFEPQGAGSLPQCWTSAVVTFPLAFALILHLPRQFTSASLRPFFRPELWGHSSVGLVLRAAFFSSGSHEIFKLGMSSSSLCTFPAASTPLAACSCCCWSVRLGGWAEVRTEGEGWKIHDWSCRAVVLCRVL